MIRLVSQKQLEGLGCQGPYGLGGPEQEGPGASGAGDWEADFLRASGQSLPALSPFPSS